MQLSNKYPEVGPVSQYKLIYMYVCVFVCVNSGNTSGQEIKGKDKVNHCTGTEALYRP